MLDAGVLIGHFDEQDPFHAAVEVALRPLIRRMPLVLPASAYGEVLVGPLRSGSAGAVDRVDRELRALGVRVAVIGRDVAAATAGLRARHGRRLRLPDALIIGAALALGAEQVMTTDARWPELDGVTVRVLAP